MIIRRLKKSDFSKGYLNLLSQLTVVGDVTQAQFEAQFDKVTSHIIVAEDINTNQIVGSITIAIEQKFIHKCGCVGHIEDVVVDQQKRKAGLGSILLDAAKSFCLSEKCYKIILDCNEANVPFYEKSGFKKKEVQMVLYLL